MSNALDHSETTIVWDYPAKQVEIYTTNRRLWLRCIRRSPNFLVAQDLKPGYRLVYGVDATRKPELILDPAPGGHEAERRFLTPEEVASRQAKRERAVSMENLKR